MDRFTCQSCGAALSAENLDRRLGIITCHHCGAIYDLTRRPGAEGSPEGSAATATPAEPKHRAPVALPDRFRVGRRGGDLRIEWRWFTPKILFFLFFAVAWDGFLVFWYSIALTQGAPWIFIVFPVAHVAVGVGITYYALAGLLNKTTVEASAGTLKVSHRPVPWYPAPTLRTRDIEQIYVERKVRRSKNGTSVTFVVSAVTRTHAGRKLVGGLESLDQALFIEQELEETLGIRDRAVAGEYRTAEAHT